MSFSSEMLAWQKKAIKAMEDKAQEIAEDAITSLIERSPHPTGASNPSRASPYSKGEYVNNWYVGGSVGSQYTEALALSKESKINELKSQIKGWFDNNKTLYIYVNSPYASKVEYFGWNDGAQAYYPIKQTVQYLESKY